MTPSIATALRTVLGQAELERDIRAELQTHLDELRESLLAEGYGPDEATARARARFGDLERHVEACLVERWKKEQTMRTTMISICVILAGALMFSLAHGHALRAEAAMAQAEMHQYMALAQATRQAHTEDVPRPVIFGIGDVLTVHDCVNPDEVNVQVRVMQDGMVLLPEVGWVMAYGKERSAFEAELTERYSQYFQDTRVVVAPAGAVQ